MTKTTCRADKCCCNCKWHILDHYHCWIDKELAEKEGRCVCFKPKGWICMCPETGAHSGWPEHSLCEMWEEREDSKE